MTNVLSKDKLRKVIGSNIRSERIARDMSLEELAELLELSTGSVGLIERGERGATNYTLSKLSAIFQRTIDEFFEKPQAMKLSEPDEIKVKRTKITSLLHGLGLEELDFMIQVIKSLKTMRANVTVKKEVVNNETEDDEEE